MAVRLNALFSPPFLSCLFSPSNPAAFATSMRPTPTTAALIRHALKTTVSTTLPTASSRAVPLVSRPLQSRTTVPRVQTRTMASSCSSTFSSRSGGGLEKLPSSPIRVLRTIPSLRLWRRPHLLDHRSVALVPTMGALHSGHLSLIRQAAKENHHVVVSIYVNPAQFGIAEDLDSYPKTWDSDVAALVKLDRELADDGENLGRISAVFAPTTQEMYPGGFPGQEVDSKGSFVTITPVGELLEGKTRPTFFRGVATVCMKLFNIVQPEKVYFGQKDVQQTVIIKRLVQDFAMPIEVVIGKTERDPVDGLALSSRNVYLGERRRKRATVLYDALKAAEEVYLIKGARRREVILGVANMVVQDVLREEEVKEPDERVRFEVDYLSLADPDTMEEIGVVDPARGGILSGAIKMLPVERPKNGEDLGHSRGPAVRLIDNIILEPELVKKE
ncbi:hypothetical protein QBC36DRAFT_338817 [Triangularia setosa]|uniref:Pantoate--beta-alanine ligase n=1 Tax=Triangularia setosa TaxID=2587417 RepID=A0AAN7A3H7_9PEZI|nr:hypothetical protein QBC36DRAFT_338817 [Podospora setosa]